VVFSVVSVPHSVTSNNKSTGWLGVNDLKEMEYCRNILLAVYAADAASTSIFDILYMALHLTFNHSLLVCYAISGKAMGAQLIEAWNVFTGKYDSS
jgi:hypothetical protein